APRVAPVSTAGTVNGTPLAASTDASAGASTTTAAVPGSARAPRSAESASELLYAIIIAATPVTPGTAASRSAVSRVNSPPWTVASPGTDRSATRSRAAATVPATEALNTPTLTATTSTASGPAVAGVARPARVK